MRSSGTFSVLCLKRPHFSFETSRKMVLNCTRPFGDSCSLARFAASKPSFSAHRQPCAPGGGGLWLPAAARFTIALGCSCLRRMLAHLLNRSFHHCVYMFATMGFLTLLFSAKSFTSKLFDSGGLSPSPVAFVLTLC